MLHTPLAKERRRAQALLWLAEGLPPPAEQISPTRFSCQPSDRLTTGRNEFPCPAREGLDLRARLLDAPRLGPPSLDLSGIIDPLIEAAIRSKIHAIGLGLSPRSGPPNCCVHYLGQAHGIEGLPQERELGDHNASISAGNGPELVGVAAGNLCAKQKGAKNAASRIARCPCCLMLDETIVCPRIRLRCIPATVPICEQAARCPLSGTHNKRSSMGRSISPERRNLPVVDHRGFGPKDSS